MNRLVTLLLAATSCVLAGCGDRPQPVEAPRVETAPDYHTLLGDENKAAFDFVRDKCLGSSTRENRDANPWCGAHDKAVACNGYLKAKPSASMPNPACPSK